MRRFYLVSYDIPDDKRRVRVFKLMRGWGERVQYSVFCCQLNPRERLELIEELKTRMNASEDQTLIVDAGAVKKSLRLSKKASSSRPPWRVMWVLYS